MICEFVKLIHIKSRYRNKKKSVVFPPEYIHQNNIEGVENLRTYFSIHWSSVDLGLTEKGTMTVRNPFLQGLASLVANTSIGVKIVSAIILLLYCLSYSETALLSLSLTPGYFWPPHFWLWTAFTYSFLEIHCWIVFIDIVTIFLVCF